MMMGKQRAVFDGIPTSDNIPLPKVCEAADSRGIEQQVRCDKSSYSWF